MPDLIHTTRAESDAPAIVAHWLDVATRDRASDLSFDPGADVWRVRMRRDGVLRTVGEIPASVGGHVVGRCKALADLLVYRQDLPQEGRMPASRVEGATGDVRVATFPTVHGERVALRFEAGQDAPRELSELGLEPQVLAQLSDAIEQPDGVVLLTGPSGSGKTTTLYSCLRHLVGSDHERTIVSVEDPVERRIDGVVQAEVDAAAGLDFARALRSLLRQDPDVLLLGEIRDRETAAIALEAGLTGHLVASTVHAGSAPEVFARLLEMGVEPFVLTTTVRGVLAQRLLRRRCAACEGEGCARCGGAGYDGRVLLAEWLPMHDALRRAVLDRRDGRTLAAAACEGKFEGLRSVAERLVARGVTDEKEVLRVLGRDR